MIGDINSHYLGARDRELIFNQQEGYGLTGTRTEMTGLKSIKLRIEKASLHLSIFRCHEKNTLEVLPALWGHSSFLLD